MPNLIVKVGTIVADASSGLNLWADYLPKIEWEKFLTRVFVILRTYYKSGAKLDYPLIFNNLVHHF